MINFQQLKHHFHQHRKIIIILAGISFIFLIALISLSPKKSSSPTTSPLPSLNPNSTSFTDISQPIIEDFTLPNYTQPPLKEDNTIDQSNPQLQLATKTKAKLLPHLPIYYPDFSTSVNITTTINIFSLPQDLDHLIHLDIYGINYQNSSLDPTVNPQVTAFKESFLKAKNLLQEKGVNLQDIYFVFGGPPYVQTTAQTWIKALNLL